MEWAWVVLTVVLVVLAAATALAEAALSSMSRVRALSMVEDGRPGAQRLLTIASDPPRYVATLTFVRVACEVGAVVVVTRQLLGRFTDDVVGMLVALGVMIVVTYVVVGVAPRTLGRQHAERLAPALAGPVVALTRILGPLPVLLIGLGNALTPGRGFREGPFATEAELRELVDMAETNRVIEPREREMIHSVFELGDTVAREVMVPRMDVVSIERGKSLRQALSLALRSGMSRIPVVGEDLDDVLGIVYLKDVVRRTHDNRDAESTEQVESIMRPAAYVPDSKPVDELLREMQAQRTHLAIVVDEYGGTAGLVTIEDILEEIVGEIVDEYDAIEVPVQALADGSVRISARLHVDDLAELFDVDLHDDDVDTVAGLMAKVLGRVPIPGASCEVGGLHLVAESTAGRRNRVGTVLVRRVDGSPGEGADGSRRSGASSNGQARAAYEATSGQEQHA
jgi:CBS domain containing-hemolysin-like protein